jgi:hypothetical protein
VSTDPTTVRGSIRPELSSAGVPIGPQPPPPAASMKPANAPSGDSANQGNGFARFHESSAWRRKLKRTST